MNPLYWRREHQVAWGVVIILGMLLGIFWEWALEPISHTPQYLPPGVVFVAWVQNPNGYWPWGAFGGAIAALAFYAIKLLRTSN